MNKEYKEDEYRTIFGVEKNTFNVSNPLQNY